MITQAITRKPCSRFAEGITTADLGLPDYGKVLRQHAAYVQALRQCGLAVQVLDADENFPDSCFVEDVAVLTERMMVVTNPGALSRNGEVKAIIPVLQGISSAGKALPIHFIEAPGTLEGGDVMQAGNHFFIGLTERTNEEGARQLGNVLSAYGYTASMVTVPDALHLKSVVNYIGNNNVLVASTMMYAPWLRHFHLIEVPARETYACNGLLINDKLIMPSGFQKTHSKLLALGYQPLELNMTEFEKMDGGITCLSLRY